MIHTIEQAAELIDTHPLAVQRAVARGHLAAAGLPHGAARVMAADFEKFLKTQAGELALPPGLDPRQPWFQPLSSYPIQLFAAAAYQAIGEFATPEEIARRAAAGENRVDLTAPAAALRSRPLKPMIRNDRFDALAKHFRTEAALFLTEELRDHALQAIRQKTALQSPLRRLYASTDEYRAVRDEAMTRLKAGGISQRYSVRVGEGAKAELRTVEVRIPNSALLGTLDLAALAF